MQLSQRLAWFTAFCFGTLVWQSPLQAQDYPTRPIRLIVGYSAGGGNDLIGRLQSFAPQHALGRLSDAQEWPGGPLVRDDDSDVVHPAATLREPSR